MEHRTKITWDFQPTSEPRHEEITLVRDGDMNVGELPQSAARRVRLLTGFDSLDEDARADLLEAVETMAFTGTAGRDFADAREIMRRVWAAAGLESER